MLTDTPELRSLLSRIFRSPRLVIDDVPQASGQRVVFFCHFEPVESDGSDAVEWIQPESAFSWGPIVLKASNDVSPQSAAYLQREAELLSSLNSPFYPKLIFSDSFHEDPDTEMPLGYRLFVTLEERIDALSLANQLTKYSQETTAVCLFSKLIEALEPLWNHPKRLVHRDLKPDNILVKENGDVCIIDLGIFREEGSVGLTNTYHAWGPCSHLYASPEQLRNDKYNISYRSDFFSLGTIFYELLSGANPFGKIGDSIGDVIHRVNTLSLPGLDTQGLCSREFSDVIAKAMEKQPYMRFRLVDDLKYAIAACNQPANQ